MNSDTPLSDELLMQLSAYVDGELDTSAAMQIEELIAANPAVAAEVEALTSLNNDLKGAFDQILSDPVPTPEILLPTPANTNRAPWLATAATFLIGAVLGAGLSWGYLDSAAPEPVQVAAKRSWLGEVAEYHQVYARQKRHLVEIPASEKDHIETWLGKEIGVDFKVPDLASAGWEFQGARLLVAAGKPVAQLMYTNANGDVIALCGLSNGSGAAADVKLRQFGDVHMATWKSATGSFAIVGDKAGDLTDLAKIAAPLI